MKTKFKYLALVAVSLLIGFSGCSNEDEKIESSDTTKNLFLKISSESPSTYTEGTPVTNGTTVDFISGDLYFVNGTGTILKHYTLSSATTDDTNISLTDIQAGTTIQNLPGTVARVHVTGNTTGLPVTGNISAVTGALLQVETQHDIENVNLYGDNGITLVSGEETKYTCNITLRPTVARIELTDITATGLITGFQVDGIFVDNYYSRATINATLASANLIDNGSTAADFNYNSTAYPSVLNPAIYDFYSSGLTATSNLAAPASGDVWSYNLFANSNLSGSAVPRIVIRLSNITASDPSINVSGTQFITVRGFKNTGGSLAGIKRGEVYNIGAGVLTFSESDLSPIPNERKIEVEVTVTLTNWTVINVTPDI